MIFDIFLICVIVLIIAVIINGVEDSNKHKISFKESMDLADLPIVTFRIGDKKINFLLDSGASLSVINSTILDDYMHVMTNKSGTVFGMEGNKQENKITSMDICLDNKVYSEEFQVVDMSNAFDSVKKENGVTIHGILGNSFLSKYNYVLDFSKLECYEK